MKRLGLCLLAVLLLFALAGCSTFSRQAQLLPAGPYGCDGLADGTFQGAQYDTGNYSLRGFSLTISGAQAELGVTTSHFGELSRTDETDYYIGTATVNADNTVSVTCTRMGRQLQTHGFGVNTKEMLQEVEAAYAQGEVTEEELDFARRYYKGERIEQDLPADKSASFTVQIDAEKKVFLLLSLLDESGYKTVYTYHNSGTISSITEYEPDGTVLYAYAYGKDGTPLNGEVLEYDEKGRVVRKQWYQSGTPLPGYTTYEYNSAGRLSCLKVYGDEYDWSSESYVDTCTTYLLEYDSNNRVVRAKKTVAYENKVDGYTVIEYYSYKDEENHKIKKEAIYGDNDRLEAVHQYDTNGSEVSVTYYNYNGPDLLYYETVFTNGDDNLLYHPDGTLLDKDEALPDIPHGHTDENGVVRCKVEYDAEGRVVKSFNYDENGKLTHETYYSRSGYRAQLILYNPNGTLSEKYTYKDGKQEPVGSWSYDENGVITYSSYIKDGKEYTEHYTDGKLESVYITDEDSTDWYHTMHYDKNGKLQSEWLCEENQKTHKCYYSTGELESVHIMDIDEISLSYVEYYKNGKKKREELFYENGDIRETIDYTYHANGNLKTVDTWYFELGANSSTDRVIVEYDKNGNKIDS